jgi:sugar/nucleoside kinase (ribokinase family)
MRYVCTMGEVLVEIMRKEMNVPLSEPGLFVGPYPSGAPAIFIDALAKWGVSAAIIGSVGNDDFGKCVLNRLDKDGVDINQINVSNDKPTGTAFVTYYDHGGREFIFNINHSAAGEIYTSQLNWQFLKHVQILHLNGSTIAINDDIYAACYEAAKIVKQNGGTVCFDPNLRLELLKGKNIKEYYAPFIEYCDYLLPSSKEAELITEVETIEGAVRDLLERGIKGVICKKGEEGCTAYFPNETTSVRSFKVDAVDPTGAGDCFNAGFTYGLLQGWGWKQTLTFANAAGALAASKQGPMEGTERLENVERFIAMNRVSH